MNINAVLKKLGLMSVLSNKERKDYERRIQILEAELRGSRRARDKLLRILGVSSEDPVPSDVKKRARYVQRAGMFFVEILEPKLLQLIAQTREEMDDPQGLASFPAGSNRLEYDWFLRGTSNAFKLLLDWGELMKSEHAANQLEDNNTENG